MTPPSRPTRARHWFEAAPVWILFVVLGLLPVDLASWLGGAIARAIGPFLPVSKVARENLSRAFPSLPKAEVAAVVRGVWDNLGRTAAEYPHLRRLAAERVEIHGAEHLASLRDDDRPGVCFSGHLANWELLPLVAARVGVPLTNVYRPSNNPLIDRLLARARGAGEGRLVPKGSGGARALLAALKEGEHLGMLVDQKMNDGIPVPFFGRPAFTAPAAAELALRFACPLLGGKIERLGGARFRLVIEPPLFAEPSGDRARDALELMTRVNRTLERWIADRPAEWLWLHRRWPKN